MLFLQSFEMPKDFWQALSPFTMLFFNVHYSFHEQHEQHKEGVTIIESSLGARQGDPLRGPLFAIVCYWTFL